MGVSVPFSVAIGASLLPRASAANSSRRGLCSKPCLNYLARPFVYTNSSEIENGGSAFPGRCRYVYRSRHRHIWNGHSCRSICDGQLRNSPRSREARRFLAYGAPSRADLPPRTMDAAIHVLAILCRHRCNDAVQDICVLDTGRNWIGLILGNNWDYRRSERTTQSALCCLVGGRYALGLGGLHWSLESGPFRTNHDCRCCFLCAILAELNRE